MKLTVLLLFIACMQVSAEGSAQKISIQGNNLTLKNVFHQIKKQSGYTFFYSESDLRKANRVSIKAKNTEVTDVLKQVFVGQPLGYSVAGKTVVVKANSGSSSVEIPKNGIEILSEEEPPERVITGRVTDQDGKPLSGVSVVVRGTTIGTTTNGNGRFTITSPTDKNITLEFSSVGYVGQRVVVGDRTEVVVALEVVDAGLDEVVVVGYGTMRRSLVTSAIGSFKPEPEDIRQVVSPSRLIEGRIPGVNISIGSGNLGAAERISVRGASSISAGNEPLYVIDGIPINTSGTSLFNFGESYSPLSVLNHADIESIEVLKDAASAAIYGSRASNGVVVITTRSGKEGRANVSVNLSSGFSQFANRSKLKFSDSENYIKQYNEGVDNYNKQYGLGIGDSRYKVRISNPFGDLPDTDWLGLVTRTGYFKNADVNVSGGTKATKYYVGVGITDQEGIIKENSIRKYNFNSKVSHRFNNWLEIGAHNTINYIKNNQVPGANLGSTIIARAIEQRPFDRPYKPNGDYYIGGTDELTRHNPVQIINEQEASLETYRYLGSYYGLLNLGKHFTFKSSFSADIGYTYDHKYYNANHPYGTGVGRLVESNRLITNILNENILNYNQSFGDIDISALAGHSFQKQEARSLNVDGRGFPTPSLHQISVASEIYGAGGSPSEYAMESYFGRATASYLGKYIFTSTLRADGSSKFHPNHRWGLFPSVSFGWNASKEDFLKGVDIDLKLRASYGQTGNQEGIGNYAYQAQISGGQNYGNESGISVSTFGNSLLTWEKANQFDVGFDLGLLNGQLNFIFDVYLKNTKDLLYSMPIHATTGMTSIISNIGSMRNEGAELAVNTNFNLGQVNWKSQFNIAHNKNKITSLVGDDAPISIGGNRALQVGNELGAYYLFVMEGLYQYDGEVPQALYDLGVRAGDVKWRDVDENDIINDNDRQIVGTSNPDFSGGWNNSFNYKGFQIDLLTTYMYGNDVYAEWKPTGSARVGYRFNQLVEYVENRWTGPGTTNVYPRPIDGDINNTRNSTRFLEDGSFIRLRAVTLGYNFPTHSAAKLGISGLRVYAQVDNLFLATKYSGWDPEVNNNLDPRFTGVDLFAVPQPRTFSIGVNVNL